MASPLLEFANARIMTRSGGVVGQDADGRIYTSDETRTLVICYMKRIQYTGVTSGSRKVPLASELNGEMLPGASGDEFYYRGYALQAATVDSSYDWTKADVSDATFTDITSDQPYLRSQKEIQFLFGDQLMKGTIQRGIGKFGGSGIDEIIYPAIGVELQITGGEVLN